mgnify:CR=1 FL=1
MPALRKHPQTATKHLFVTGGVVSSLGKGLTASSLGQLLTARGLQVTMQKLDPYLNVDPGTMNPFQHGEVFVTEDGAETDLDLGHYERFTGVSAWTCSMRRKGAPALVTLRTSARALRFSEARAAAPVISPAAVRIGWIADQVKDAAGRQSVCAGYRGPTVASVSAAKEPYGAKIAVG